MGPHSASPQHEVEQRRGPGHGNGWRVQTSGGDGERPRRWRLRGSVGAEARQCPLKLCQSGLDDAERDRAATVDVAVEGTQASRASILPTSVWESEEDNRKVAGTCSEALRRLKTTSTAGKGGPVSQRPPQDGLQSLSDGTVNIRTGLADVGGRTGDRKTRVASR